MFTPRLAALPLTLLSVLVLCGLSGCGYGLSVHRKTELSTVPHVEDSAIKVVSQNGLIRVERVEGLETVEIKSEVRSSSLERLDLARLEAYRLADQTLSVYMEWPEGKRAKNEGASFVLRVPDANGIDLRSSNGRIEAIGLRGSAKVNTSNGSIIVDRHDGHVDVRTSNGSVQILEPAGDVIARSSNGNIRVKDARYAVSVTTSNGPVNVLLTDDNPGPVSVTTSNGSIKLGVGTSFVGRLIASTSNASINFSDLGQVTLNRQSKNLVDVVLGENVHESKVSTSNGSIIVERPF